MSTNLSIESPDFARVRRGDFYAIEDAIRLLWFVANEEARLRRSGGNHNKTHVSNKIVQFAPSGNLNNVDYEGSGFVIYTGATGVNVTGYRTPIHDGDVLLILVTGSGTITHQNQNASSDAGNRMVFNGGADQAVATNEALLLTY